MTPTLNRRRFLTLTAAALATPATADVTEWHGIGLGATLSLRLLGGTSQQARRTLRQVENEIARIEATASLYRASSLTRLNRDGYLSYPSPDLLHLLTLSDRIHSATEGVFDPTVQPLWMAVATDGDTTAARALIGWNKVRASRDEIRLLPGQALTLNGIAQGWAADQIANLLRASGYTNALIDLGEVQALGNRQDGGPWRAQIAGPDGRPVARVPLSNRALATSSPMGTRIGKGQAHILGPQGQLALWQTISVSAPSAALADALSTAFCLMSKPQIDKALADFPEARLEAAA